MTHINSTPEGLQPDALDARTVDLTDAVLDEMIREHDGDGEFPSATAVYVKHRRNQMRLTAAVLLRAAAPRPPSSDARDAGRLAARQAAGAAT